MYFCLFLRVGVALDKSGLTSTDVLREPEPIPGPALRAMEAGVPTSLAPFSSAGLFPFAREGFVVTGEFASLVLPLLFISFMGAGGSIATGTEVAELSMVSCRATDWAGADVANASGGCCRSNIDPVVFEVGGGAMFVDGPATDGVREGGGRA